MGAFRLLDVDALDKTASRWIAGAGVITARFRGAAAQLGIGYVARFGIAPVLPRALDARQFAINMHVTGIAAIKIAMSNGQGLARARAIGMSLSEGSAERLIMDAERDVITQSSIADEGTYGWQRVGDGDCSFCQDLINNVYTDEPDFLSHDRCQCVAEIVTG